MELLQAKFAVVRCLTQLTAMMHQIVLGRSSYPLYIADRDGISHTTLIIACLRKLQGWHMDSIVDEICRFEPDHEDYSPWYHSSPRSSLHPIQTLCYRLLLIPSWLWPVASTRSCYAIVRHNLGTLPLEKRRTQVQSPRPRLNQPSHHYLRLPYLPHLQDHPLQDCDERDRTRTESFNSINNHLSYHSLILFKLADTPRCGSPSRLHLASKSTHHHYYRQSNPNINSSVTCLNPDLERVASDDSRVTGGEATSANGTAGGKAGD